MPRRVLVLSASVGAGHLRAAQAVELAVKDLDPQADVKNLDVLELTNPGFRALYSKAYLDLVNRIPHVLGYFYDLMDRPRSPRQRSDRLRRLVEKLNLRRFVKFLEEEPWDVIVNTHFLPAEMIASLKRNDRLATPQMTVTTDFETHRLWANEPCEHYFTATAEGAAYLHYWGVPRENISVTGIPIHPVFCQPKERDDCLRCHHIAGDRPIILQLSGGFGIGPIEQIHEGLLHVETPLDIIVVTGRNAELKQRLEEMPRPERHRVTVLGYTDQMDELMRIADLIVTKPGGLTTSEALACGAAMVVVNPIPGQESQNCDFLLENGAAIKVNHAGILSYKLTQLLGDADRLAQLKQRARALGRPRAAYQVAQRALSWPA